jgi:hypothetical protein
MAKDSGVPPLPRRVPGAAGSPRPPARVEPTVLPESVRQHLLDVLADAQERAAQEGSAALEEAPRPEHVAAPQDGAPLQDAAVPERVAAPEDGLVLGDVAPEHVAAPAEDPAAPEQALPLPRTASVANDLPPSSPDDSRGAPPPSLPGRHSDSEALTEPFPRFSASSGHDVANGRAAGIGAQPDTSEQRDRGAGHRRGDTEHAAATAMAQQEIRQAAGRRKHRSGHGYRIAGVVIAVMVVITAGSLAVALSAHTGAVAHGGRASAAAARRATAIREHAAAWVAAQVSRTAVVSCDPTMCQALKSQGFPPGELSALGPATISPLGSDVIVATAAVREHFGELLSSVYAPAVLASFGSGQARIDIRQVAPHGVATYRSELAADLRSRKADGAALLTFSQILASAAARRQLEAGQVDARLLVAIADMASVRPIYIVDFSTFAPGADSDMPLRFADVIQGGHTHDPASRPLTAAFVRSMTAVLQNRDAPYRPAHIETVRLAGGKSVLRIEFTAPSLFGLLSGHQGL